MHWRLCKNIERRVILYEGRVDSQIKVRGHRVDLTEVEKAVSKAPGVDEVVVLCYKPGELSQALLAFVTVTNDSSTCTVKIETFLQANLPVYMLPRVIILDNIPLLTNGKTDRQTLLKQYESSHLNNENEQYMNCDYIDVPEADLAKAKVLFPTVASVIGGGSRADVRIDANFYEIGGNSLNSIYTVTKLQDQGLRDRNHRVYHGEEFG